MSNDVVGQVENEVVGTDTDTQTTETKGKRGRKKLDLPSYPIPEDGIVGVPTDWSKDKYKMLKPSDFTDEADYLEWRGTIYRDRGQRMIDKAEGLRKLGSPKEREAASRMEKLTRELESLRATLLEAGQDPEQVLAMLRDSE